MTKATAAIIPGSASVLNHFLSMYISINSFSYLTANTSERKARALEPWSWPLQIGNRPPV
ncbi:MAG UNVERIFIED_CONTAM: hypothetical protein LVR18_16770 [Planctomycetaceae bacterium]